MFSTRFLRACGMMLPLGLLAFVVGCGSSAKPRAVVKGKVTIGDKALTVGTVQFFGTGNAMASARIDKDGNYEMNDAPVGDVQISVTVPKMPPGGIASMKSGPAKGAVKDATKSVDPNDPSKSISIMGDMPTHVVPIPDKYGIADSSGLTYKVEKGEQIHNLKLTP